MVVLVNGLPLVVIELKNPVDENATIDDAYNQLQTYKDEIPSHCFAPTRLAGHFRWPAGTCWLSNGQQRTLYGMAHSRQVRTLRQKACRS